MAVQDYELMLRVRADLMEAISGLKGLTTKLGEGDAAAKQLGETADETSTRIHAMVQASVAQQKAMESSTASTARAVEQSKRIIQSADEEAAAFRRGRDATEAWRAAEKVRSGAPAAAAERVAAIAAQRAELEKLVGQIDPTIRAMAKLDAQEKSLNAMRKAGVVGIEDYTRFKSAIDANRLSIGGAAKEMHKFSINTSQSRLELGRLIKDISTGQYGRLTQTSFTLANQAGFLSVLFSPLGLAIGAVAGSLGAFALAAVKAGEDTDKFNKSIQQTGNYAGVTAGQLDNMAFQITSANGSVSESRTVLNTLAASGRVGGESLQALGQAAVNMAALTGKSAAQATQEVLKLFDGTAAGALKADDQYHFLTTSIYDQIKALEDQGDTQQAMDVAAEAFNAAALERQKKLQEELSATATWWDNVRGAAGHAWEEMKRGASLTLGLAGPEVQLSRLQAQKALAAQGVASGSVFDYFFGTTSNLWTSADEAKMKALVAQIDKSEQAAKDDGTRNDLNSAANHADAGLDRLASSIDKAYGKKEKIKELNKYFTDLWAGADPNNAKLNNVQRFVADDGSVNYSGGLYDTLLADINKAPKPRGRSQASIDKTAAAAQQQLIEALGQVQGKLDPTAAAWANYNKEVDKANKLAATAKTGSQANIEAINGERDAYIAVAAKVRDAKLAEEAEKDRKAYEKLRDSIKDVDNVTLGKAFAQLKQLQKYLHELGPDGKPIISQKEFDQTSSAVIDANITKLPKYKGLDATVGGAFGEVEKATNAQAALDQAYTKQLDALNQFHDAKLLSDQDFVTKENALFQSHAVETKQIDAARQKAMLMGITQSFASAAEAVKQGFGEQSGAYRAAFALAKSAAIAQATVAMYTDIAKAVEKGWPQNIPLIAQATAEGLTLIGNIRGLGAGFDGGGYTGPGAVHQPAGIVHAGEVVFSQRDVARHGGPDMVEAMRLGFRGYADGGIVGAFPSPQDFPPPANQSMSDAMAARSGGGGGQAPQVSVRNVNIVDPALVHDAMSSSEGERVILNTISRNRSSLKQVLR